jgi:hypothetical protein
MPSKTNKKESDVLNEVLCDSVYLFFRVKASNGFEVEIAIAFQKALSDAFQLLTIF